MNQEEQQSTGNATRTRRCAMGRRSRLGVAALALAGAGAVLGALAVTAVSVAAHKGRDAHFAHGAHHSAVRTVDDARERAEDVAAWIAGRADASDEQAGRVTEILVLLSEALFPLGEQHAANRRSMLRELARPVVDREALESIRVAELALLDEASAGALEAVAALSEVLDADQRAELLRLAGRFGHHRRF